MSPNEFADLLVAETDQGIRMCGEHTFWDKGPHEVVNTSTLGLILEKMAGSEAGACLETAALRGKTYLRTCEAVISLLDDAPEDWWLDCCDACPSVEY